MLQITHFCGVKLLAWKSGCVKFWTNIMSGQCHHSSSSCALTSRGPRSSGQCHCKHSCVNSRRTDTNSPQYKRHHYRFHWKSLWEEKYTVRAATSYKKYRSMFKNIWKQAPSYSTMHSLALIISLLRRKCLAQPANINHWFWCKSSSCLQLELWSMSKQD